MAEVSLAQDSRCILGESPVCDSAGGVHFVDISGKLVHSYDSVNGACAKITTPQSVGCIVPRLSGGFLAALEDSVIGIDVKSQILGDQVALLPPGHHCPKIRFNDGKCDPEGRFWVGTMHSEWRNPEAPHGRLYVLPSSTLGTPSTLVEKVSPTRLSNGMAWSSDNRSFFWIDSFYKTVEVFDYDAITGEIDNRRVAVKVSDSEPGPPDGMAIDSNDKLWIVIGETGSVRQYDPETGSEIFRVDLPVRRPTSCAFGGKDLSELYVTTREETGPAASQHAGGLFRCRIPGARGPSFADAYRG